MIRQPVNHKVKYPALSILLERLGSDALLRLSHDCGIDLVSELLIGAASMENVAAACGLLLVKLLRFAISAAQGGKLDENAEKSQKHNPKPDMGAPVLEWEAKWRELWVMPVLGALLHPVERQRFRTATYVLPEIIRLHARSVIPLVGVLQEHSDDLLTNIEKFHIYSRNRLPLNEDDEFQQLSIDDRILWAQLQIAQCCKSDGLMNLAELTAENSTGILKQQMLKESLLHENHELRLTALSLITQHRQTTASPSIIELQMVKMFLEYNMKITSNEFRQRVLECIKMFLDRVSAGDSQWRKQVMRCKDKHVTPELTELAVECQNFVSWLEKFALGRLYPGAPIETVHTALELMLMILQIFEIKDSNVENKDLKSPCVEDIPSLCLEVVNTKDSVNTLLNLLVNSWDLARNLAAEVISLLPAPLAGYEDTEKLESLLKFCVTLSGSPRRRECDAAACLFASILNVYCRTLKWNLELPTSPIESHKTEKGPLLNFFWQLLAILDARLDSLDSLLKNAFDSGDINVPAGTLFPHGLFLAIRHMMNGLVSQKSFSFEKLSEIDNGFWKEFIEALFERLMRGYKMSLSVVAEGIGEDDNDNNDDDDDGTEYKAKGRVDCRGHLITEDMDTDPESDQQLMVVASWLLTKEAASCFSTVVCSLPCPKLVDTHQVAAVGNLFLSSLLALKHMGAVSHTASAFKDLCSHLLRCHDKQLSILPSNYLDQLIHRMKSSDQQFILRRSAGFAFAFLSLLSSEPINCKAVLFPKCVRELISIADTESDEHRVWRARVHALNVLKLITQDASLADDITAFLPDIARCVLKGFRHTSWAVRNSSMMVFAKLVMRAIGSKRVKDEQASVNRVTASQFFARFPELYDILLNELRQAREVGSTSSTGEMHPSLYPVLLMLSRLRPDIDNSGKMEAMRVSSEINLKPFLELVVACASDRHHMARVMSARAIVSLIPGNSVFQTIMDLLDQLPLKPSVGAGQMSHNAYHGALTHILHLLKTFPLKSQKEVDAIGRSLVLRLWLCEREVMSCAPVTALMIEVANEILRKSAVDNVYMSAVANLWQKVCIEIISRKSERIPGFCKMKENATALFIDMSCDRQLNELMKVMVM
eukprot:TRINITY_DN15713_c0_g1_i1.p1 TRINITY_DN15713_c0_g1~~TRINITY_DN15713_c0_g1_i1.p1  ORF type:complete len:1110 (-),score=341.25 TRINITY_DN15713_c0_g1_i1:1739-5068(-)